MSSLKSAAITAPALAVLLAFLVQEELADQQPVTLGDHSLSGRSDPSQVEHPVPTDRPPLLIRNVKPVYPEAARAARVRGLVIVSFTVGVEGTVTHAQVGRSIPLLDEAVLDAVKQWRFEPALSGGVAVPATRATAVALP